MREIIIMITAIFPAAGQGKRMGMKVNKIFLSLGGKTVLYHTLYTFSKCEMIDELVVVASPEEVTVVRELLKTMDGLKPWQVVAGGLERQYSIENALEVVSPGTKIILVHDAARPIISTKIIEKVIEETRHHGATITAVRAKDTIKVVDEKGIVIDTPQRNGLWAVQTPQGFQADILKDAYQKAKEDDFLGTDDASLVERMGRKVKVVEGDYTNIKITTPEDLIMAESFIKRRSNQ